MACRQDRPWLDLRFEAGVPAGRWVEIGYESSWFDSCVRPLLRCSGPYGLYDAPLVGPLLGRAGAVVHIPQGTRAISIQPVPEPAPFGFALTRWDVLDTPEILLRAWRNDAHTAIQAVGARIFGGPEETRQILRAALGGVPMADYPAWAARTRRGLDLLGLDAPRFDWTAGPRLVVALMPGDEGRAEAVAADLAGQPYPRWSLASEEAMAHLDDADLIALLPRRGRLAPEALAVFAEMAVRYPLAKAFYADELIAASHTGRPRPRLRPDWRALDGGRIAWGDALVFLRASALRGPGTISAALRASAPLALDALVPGLLEHEVRHVRRLLLERDAPAEPACPARTYARTPALPSVGIVIPTRNRADLLETCLDGVLNATEADGAHVVLVDNGSTQRRVKRLYESLRGHPRVTILMRPGRFNFSWLCNEGAAAARGDALVFLNNDIEVIEPGWLRALLHWVDRPDIGAVGARLLYPGVAGVQHDGVVLGVGGFAGHVYARRPREGWDGNDAAPRCVSAVTGACLAVMRAKFEAVGGFDAVDLPVDLSDVDLCLKLDAAGWGSLLVPESRLIHRESATRGDAMKPFKQYGRERRVFRDRWGERLRDDPFYHPALSLWSRGLRLG